MIFCTGLKAVLNYGLCFYCTELIQFIGNWLSKIMINH